MRHVKIHRDAGDAMIRAVLELAHGHAALDEHRGTQWASATFTGMRHAMTLRFVGEAAVMAGEHLAAALPAHEFALIGHVVADVHIVRRARRELGTPSLSLEIEALTVEDA